MKKRFRIIVVAVMAVALISADLSAQGIVHSKGIGLRLGIWKYSNSPYIETSPGQVVVTPVSASFYFYSRLSGNWFMEAGLGSVGEVEVNIGKVETVALVPLNFGVRYDLLSAKIESVLQPYLSFGAGNYWISRSLTQWGSVIAENDARLGLYAGAGVNIILNDWLALNSDLKYHFVNFDNTPVENYNGFALGLGVSYMWGEPREFFRIEEIKIIVQDIYPAYYQFYNTYPIALVTILNTAGFNIEVNLHSNIQGYSERPNESGFVNIAPGETADIPVVALFGKRLFNASKSEPAVIDLKAEARAGATQTRDISINVMVHNRNAWNGEMDRLSYFLTPDDRQIMELGRSMIADLGKSEPGKKTDFQKAKVIFDALKEMNIRYQRDPNIPFYKDDYVQFASETLKRGTGDCDDMVILYASLLEGIGIKTVFVEVRDPDKEPAHLYLMFDTGIEPQEGALLTSNEKRYVIRESRNSKKTIWIPVETTLIVNGFDTAWEEGAMHYLKEGIIRAGIANGWVRLIDHN